MRIAVYSHLGRHLLGTVECGPDDQLVVKPRSPQTQARLQQIVDTHYPKHPPMDRLHLMVLARPHETGVLEDGQEPPPGFEDKDLPTRPEPEPTDPGKDLLQGLVPPSQDHPML